MIFFLIPSLYFIIEGFIANNVKMALVGVIFMFLAFGGLLFSKVFPIGLLEKLTTGRFSDSAFAFLLGSVMIVILSNISKFTGSVATFSVSEVLASVSQNLPPSWQMVSDVVMASIGEELFFILVPITFALAVKLSLKKRYKFLDSPVTTFILYAIVAVPLFVFFHRGQVGNINFYIVAGVFRALIGLLIILDYELDIIKWATLGLTFGMGSHFTNNAINSGYFATEFFFDGTSRIIITSIYLMALVGTGIWIRERLNR